MDKLESKARAAINNFPREKLDALEPRERVLITREAERIIIRLKEDHPLIQISVEGLLTAIICALYYAKFRESPLQTVLTTPAPKGYTDDD